LAGEHVRDRLIACIAAAICIALTVVVCAEFPLQQADLPVIVAPLGASAVMVFVIPTSPLAQPWRVIGGNIVSTLFGVAVFQTMSSTALAAGVAVGGALLLMSLLRCLHPPGGAAALTAVMGSADIHAAGYAFAFAPVAINSIALVTVATVLHRWTGHSYPHELPMVAPSELLSDPLPFEDEDIDRALEDLHETFDISREDLGVLLAAAQSNAIQRRGVGRVKAA
jgi:CBS domain-containing membrane protein